MEENNFKGYLPGAERIVYWTTPALGAEGVQQNVAAQVDRQTIQQHTELTGETPYAPMIQTLQNRAALGTLAFK